MGAKKYEQIYRPAVQTYSFIKGEVRIEVLI
jgi:hypothetical protein